MTVPGVRQGTHPIGGPSVPANVPSGPWIKGLKEPGSSDDQFADHARNFVDCIKSRQRPISDVEEGYQVSTACHLANLSLQLGRKLQWDAEKEDIVGDKEAAACSNGLIASRGTACCAGCWRKTRLWGSAHVSPEPVCAAKSAPAPKFRPTPLRRATPGS